MADKIISRADARAQGLTHYFTGKPCKRGHILPRSVERAECPGCAAAYKLENPDRGRAYVAAWDQKNRHKRAAYREANRERRAAYNVAYREATREHRSEYNATWYRENRERAAKKNAAWKVANPEACRAHSAKRRRAEGEYTGADVQRILKAQNGKCAYCREKVGQNYHVDHIQPISKGGSNWPSNLQILCPTCNVRKNARDPIEYARRLGLLI